MNFPHILAPAKIGRRSSALLAGLVLVAAAACHDDKGTGPAPTGTVAGTITSSLGGPISGVKITATPTSGAAPTGVTTDGDGKFSISGVPVSDGKGILSLAQLPANCTDPGDVVYTGLANGRTVTKDVQLDCRPLTGTVAGTVTSSLGGPLADVHVSVDPSGDAPAMNATTDADGKYSIADVPAGAGIVSLGAGTPSNCTTPPAEPYNGLEDGATRTVDFTVPCNATTGALTVTVTGVVDFDANVQVTGPNSYQTTVTQTTTLTGLEPGSYAVSGTPVVVDDPIVISRYLAATAGSPTTVVAGDTASVAVTYAIRTGSGGLWFTNAGNGKIARFAAGQLHASGSPVDTTSIGGPGAPFGAAFDSAGNLWVTGQTGNKLVAYSREQLVAGGTPTPLVTVTGSMDAPNAIAFNDAAILWVASSGNSSILGYSYAQLKAGGSPTPAITITSADLQNPVAVAFDVGGNLWVANSGDATVVEFSASQLATGGNINANVKLAPTSGITKPTGLAFDAAGNLWVANSDPVGTASGVVAFTAAQLVASGASAPAIAVLLQNPSLTGGLAFDKSGGLWVSNAGANSLLKYSSDQLTSSGTPTPATTISLGAGGSLNLPAALVFDPHAGGLPIR